MKTTIDNIYNKSRRQDEKKLKIWKYAGLMLTYKCSAACEFCYYHCSPQKKGLMPIKTAIEIWQSLTMMAGDRALVHITGGEPFLYFDHMLELLRKASEAGLKGPDHIETNASWATGTSVIKKRLKALDQAGMNLLKISFDPFHAEYISRENVIRLAETAKAILGPDKVLIRWEKHLQPPCCPDDNCNREDLYRKALQVEPCRFTGRAARTLAGLVADKTIEQLKEYSCHQTYLDTKGVHIDPYGNVFSGLCSGIIVGNVIERPLHEIWQAFDPDTHPFISMLAKGGPAGLIDSAEALGYKILPAYASKCHLCTDIRQFFFDIGEHKSIIGPWDCYT
ncbi:MAG: radical SAM protein [Anaerohalosphaera sp.]|nr:radical SAM protein [Anaerohalosphaera sp.]